MRFQTDLHKARGLGAAKSGVHHWIIQRMTAIALIPLGLWFVYSFIVLVAAPYEKAYEWLSSPWAVSASILFIVFMFYHGYLGMKVILEDYVSRLFLRWILIIFIKLFSIFMAALAIVSILFVFQASAASPVGIHPLSCIRIHSSSSPLGLLPEFLKPEGSIFRVKARL
ncbi:MAG: succinate dehydrogenase, hydrophobic membrane anchor protein [Alphaproteobacteria bacterium]|nr:succinate dehydrogenase, hydrophobic membrane anchor protein [Alphaproteobacteria bacterium]